MQSKRKIYFRGLAMGLFLSFAWKAFAGGAVITAIFALFVVAIVSNSTLGGIDGQYT